MSDQATVQTLQAITQQLGEIAQILASVFPTASNTVAGAAGGASGSYLVITVAGTTYKIALLLP